MLLGTWGRDSNYTKCRCTFVTPPSSCKFATDGTQSKRAEEQQTVTNQVWKFIPHFPVWVGNSSSCWTINMYFRMSVSDSETHRTGFDLQPIFHMCIRKLGRLLLWIINLSGNFRNWTELNSLATDAPYAKCCWQINRQTDTEEGLWQWWRIRMWVEKGLRAFLS